MKDVIIIGAGISGASVARELSKYNLDVLVLEAYNDVANGSTKANSAIVHAGYDAEEGTLMAKYNALGNAMYEDLCKELDVPYKKCGSLVIAHGAEEEKHLHELMERGIQNNIPEMEIVSGEKAREIDPHLNKDVTAALWARTAGIVGPWELTVALLENAMDNGVKLEVNQKVIGIEKISGGFKVTTETDTFEAKTIVNAAGLYADDVHNLVAEPTYKITPRRGQYFILDKGQGKLINSVIFQCPTKLGKGVLVTPTAHGNLLVGPDAEDLDSSEKHNIGTTTQQLEFIKESAKKTSEDINYRFSIRNFAGLRAQSDRGDFVIEEAKDAPGFFDVGGIKSPGLTAAPAFGIDVAKMVAEKLTATKKETLAAPKKNVIFMELSDEEKKALVKEKPAYGRIICRCEEITEGEIIEVIHRNVGATTVDGVKKRCRAGMGRCQGGFCGPRVQDIIARELNRKLEDVVLDAKDSYILTNKTKN